MNRLLLFMLAILFIAGCNDQHAEKTMPSSSNLPDVKSLTDIDPTSSYCKNPVVIQGIVLPGQSGCSKPGDAYEVHSFTFATWHRLGEPPVNRKLTILRRVLPDTKWWKDFPDYSIQRMSVLLSTDETRAVFKKLLPVDTPDDELQTISSNLQKPFIVSMKQFGNFVLDRGYDWFEAETKWNGQTIRLIVPADQEKLDANAFKVAEQLWANQAKWQKRIGEFAAKELLEQKNSSWLEEGESKLTAKQFITRMKLQSITVSPDGKFDFWYEDGDLFFGHNIMISGDVEKGPTDSGIHG